MFAVRWLKPRVLHVVWPDVVPESELAQMVERHDGLLAAHGAGYVALHEAASPPRLNAKQRAFIAKWVGENVAKNHAHCLGVAYVAPSAIVRGFVTAVEWMHSRPYPTQTFADRASALSWLDGCLAVQAER